MSYQDELQARLDAVRVIPQEKQQILDVDTLETKLMQELEDEFELAQYDLDESDILRAIKIQTILELYPNAFSHPKALKIFYIVARMEGIQAKNLLTLSNLPTPTFKKIINAMAVDKIIQTNEDKALELTMMGQSLAERIGVDVFI